MLKKILGTSISHFQMALTRLGIVDRDTVFFEGGLGAQLIAYMEFREKQSHFEKTLKNNALRCDVSYFDKYKPGMKSSGLIIRKWELDRYGISIDSLRPFQASKLRKILKSRRRHPMQMNQIGDSDWALKKSASIKYLPTVGGEDLIKKKLKMNSTDNYSCIHIRRGDFTAMGVLEIKDINFVELITKVAPLLTGKIIVISDSFLTEELKSKLREVLADKSAAFLDDETIEAGAIHDFMRQADTLICSNSMFSFSAGLLAKPNSRVFAPLVFFYGDQKIRNSGRIYSLPFTSAGD